MKTFYLKTQTVYSMPDNNSNVHLIIHFLKDKLDKIDIKGGVTLPLTSAQKVRSPFTYCQAQSKF